MRMLIDGESVVSTSGETYAVSNPATGQRIDVVPKGTREDVRKAVDAAKEAFKVWSATPSGERAKILYRIAELVRERVDELGRLLTTEQGKPVGEAVSEVRSFANTFEYYAGLGGKMRGAHTPLSTGEGYFIVIKRPVGVCGAILPWNFPVSLMGWKVAPGLTAGNTFVVKPASTTPLTSVTIVNLMLKAGLHKGVVNIVTGPGGVVGEEILENPEIRKIAFTGETGTGKHVMEVASRTIKRVTLELGGSDPMIVCDDADLDLAAEGALWGRYRNCGQSCTSVKRLFLFEAIADDFLKRFLPMVKRVRVGDGLKPSMDMGPLHTAAQRESVEDFVEDATDRGAKLLTGGARPKGRAYDKGFFYLPTVLSDVDYKARIANEECFGPALPVFLVEDLDEAIKRANDSIYGLGSSVWTKDVNKASKAAELIEAGTTWVNSPPIARAEVPFGGFKQSGFGRELGWEGLEHYFETKAVQFDTTGKNKRWSFPIV